MSWNPLEKLSDIMAADAAGTPVVVETFDDAGTPSRTAMYVGSRYRIATEFINVLCTVVRIDHGARYPLHVTYLTEFGDHLREVFSPDEILRVHAL
jgi:hypothetical protein